MSSHFLVTLQYEIFKKHNITIILKLRTLIFFSLSLTNQIAERSPTPVPVCLTHLAPAPSAARVGHPCYSDSSPGEGGWEGGLLLLLLCNQRSLESHSIYPPRVTDPPPAPMEKRGGVCYLHSQDAGVMVLLPIRLHSSIVMANQSYKGTKSKVCA